MKTRISVTVLSFIVSAILNSPRSCADCPTFTKLIAAAGPEPTAMALGDVDGDGAADVVTTANHNIYLMRNTGRGVCRPAELQFFSGVAVGPALVDIDRDGDLDIVTPTDQPLLRIARNSGNGSFEIAESLNLPNPSRFVASGDFNGDGLQ